MSGIPSQAAGTQGQARAALRLPPRDLQELWFATRRHDWRSLAVVSTVPGTSTFTIVQGLGEVADLLHAGAVRARCAEAVDLADITFLVMEMSGRGSPAVLGPAPARVPRSGVAAGDAAGGEQLLIVATDSVVSAPMVLPVVLAADAVLLCIQMGITNLEMARHSIELIGRDRIIGSVILHRP
jgi:hypothetical protein